MSCHENACEGHLSDVPEELPFAGEHGVVRKATPPRHCHTLARRVDGRKLRKGDGKAWRGVSGRQEDLRLSSSMLTIRLKTHSRKYTSFMYLAIEILLISHTHTYIYTYPYWPVALQVCALSLEEIDDC